MICGVDARDNEKLLASMRARSQVRALQDDGEFIQLLDDERAVIWSFTVKNGSAYPAVSCSELGPLQGRLVFRQSMLCNGAAQTECTAFILINRQSNEAIATGFNAQQRPAR